MTKNTKTIIETMETFNPYRNHDDLETYKKIWDAVQTFRQLGIIPEKEFDIIWEFDNKLFKESM